MTAENFGTLRCGTKGLLKRMNTDALQQTALVKSSLLKGEGCGLRDKSLNVCLFSVARK